MNSDSWYVFLACAADPTKSVAGVVLCWFEFIALSACVSECVCASVCVCTQLGRTVKHRPSSNGPWKTYRLDHLPLACVCLYAGMCVLWLFLNGMVLSIQSLWPGQEQFTQVDTHTNIRFMQRLTQQTWHRKTWRMQEGKTMALWYLVWLETTQRGGRGRKESERVKLGRKRPENVRAELFIV